MLTHFLLCHCWRVHFLRLPVSCWCEQFSALIRRAKFSVAWLAVRAIVLFGSRLLHSISSST